MLLYQGLRRAPPSFEDSGGATPQGQPPPSLGIDRPCVDPAALGGPLLSSLLFEGPPKHTPRPHPLFARYAAPVFYAFPFSFAGVCPSLAVSSVNRTRTACVHLSFIGDGVRLIGGTAGGELVVWGGGALGFEDLKRLPHAGGAVTAIEADTLYDRIFVGDAAGKIAVLSLALSPIETEPLEVCLVHCGEKRGAKMCGSSKLGWHPVSSLAATGTTAGWVYLWDVREQQPVAAIQPHRGTVNKILFHPSGDSLLTSSRDSSVRLLDLRTLRSLQTHKLPSGGPSACHAAGPQAGGGGPPPAGPPPLGWEPSTLAISPAQPHVFCVGDTGGFLSFFSLLQPGGPLCRIDNSGASQAGGPTAGGPQGAGGPSSRENAIVALEWAPHGAAIASASESRLLRLWGRGAPGGPVGRALNAGALLELDGNGILQTIIADHNQGARSRRLNDCPQESALCASFAHRLLNTHTPDIACGPKEGLQYYLVKISHTTAENNGALTPQVGGQGGAPHRETPGASRWTGVSRHCTVGAIQTRDPGGRCGGGPSRGPSVTQVNLWPRRAAFLQRAAPRRPPHGGPPPLVLSKGESSRLSAEGPTGSSGAKRWMH
ncbi:polyadenylation factor subunit 2 [Cyclospora cayetanensis]|uniref:Polyadenylation factor subunit 2 n=1 Tax=Cyclospora cayetanensis TaxID=88456 RepID=A0A6P6RT14_9EIME|nr:polyadenylation factor subunit 2 [Cyclospora cayetanensis]